MKSNIHALIIKFIKIVVKKYKRAIVALNCLPVCTMCTSHIKLMKPLEKPILALGALFEQTW